MGMSVPDTGHGLPPAPAGVLLADGSPAFGAFAGNVGAIEWAGLNAALRRSALWQRFHHKRWHYVGNGTSLIIMAGIVANLYPSMHYYFSDKMTTEAWQHLLTFLGLWAVAVVAVVYMTKAQRRIPIQNAKHTRGRKVYGGERAFLPFKLNQANVMPIIFGSAWTPRCAPVTTPTPSRRSPAR